MKNGAIDLSQAGAELKFKIDPITGGGGGGVLDDREWTFTPGNADPH